MMKHITLIAPPCFTQLISNHSTTNTGGYKQCATFMKIFTCFVNRSYMCKGVDIITVLYKNSPKLTYPNLTKEAKPN